jgi:hypothetical protein
VVRVGRGGAPYNKGMRWLLAAAVAWVLADGEADYWSAKRKIELIESDQVPAGTYVTLRPRELEAYAERQVRSVVPEGIRGLRLELGRGEAKGFAFIDFPKLRRSTGQPMGGLMEWLLAGECPVRVDARIRSSGGRATVELERVEVSGLAVVGAPLDFLIQNFVLPLYPEAKIGRPFELAHRIERLEVRPGQVRVVIGR